MPLCSGVWCSLLYQHFPPQWARCPALSVSRCSLLGGCVPLTIPRSWIDGILNVKILLFYRTFYLSRPLYILIIPQVCGFVKRVSLIFFEIFLRALGEQPANSAHCEGFGSVSLPPDNYYYTLFYKKVNRFFKSYFFNRRPGPLF